MSKQVKKCTASENQKFGEQTTTIDISTSVNEQIKMVDPKEIEKTQIDGSVQYIINADPLQQIKEFVKPFHGNDGEHVSSWLDSIEEFFEITRLPGSRDANCLQYAPILLKNYARKWWLDNKPTVQHWNVFRCKIEEQFGVKNEYLIEQQLNQRKQRIGEPVMNYYYDVIDLCRQCDPTMSDKQRIRKLMNGLKLSLYQEAVKDSYSSSSEFLKKVQHLENIEQLIDLRRTDIEDITIDSNANTQQQFDRRDHYGWSSQSKNDRNQGLNPNEENKNRSYKRTTLQCFQCLEFGHIARFCPRHTTPTGLNTSNQKNL